MKLTVQATSAASAPYLETLIGLIDVCWPLLAATRAIHPERLLARIVRDSGLDPESAPDRLVAELRR
jgi:hypothetical protein